MTKAKISVSKSDRCGMIAEGNYDLTVKTASLREETVKGLGTFATAEIVAVNEQGQEIFEKFRIADIYGDGKVNVRDYRFNTLQEFLEKIYDEPVDEIDEDIIVELRGRSFNADVYHQELDDGRLFPHIDVDSVTSI